MVLKKHRNQSKQGAESTLSPRWEQRKLLINCSKGVTSLLVPRLGFKIEVNPFSLKLLGTSHPCPPSASVSESTIRKRQPSLSLSIGVACCPMDQWGFLCVHCYVGGCTNVSMAASHARPCRRKNPHPSSIQAPPARKSMILPEVMACVG